LLFFFCKKYIGIPYGPYDFPFGDTGHLRDTENNQTGMQKNQFSYPQGTRLCPSMSKLKEMYTNAEAIWSIINLQ